VVVAIAIIVIIAVGLVTVLVFAADREPRAIGSLSRETRHRETGRVRAGEARVPAIVADRGVTRWERVDEEEVGVSRRKFINRSLLAVVGLSLAGFGAASLGYLWPTGSSGFGGKILAGKVSDILDYINSHRAPFYVPAARGYLVEYPAPDLPAAKKVYSAVTYAGMEQGFVALYQRCPHLGCRVPFCPTSQWFECPCHGSKYNRVGEKKAGPAPRGMDRFAITIAGGRITINTNDIELGPPIGTNTTHQQQGGPLCV
jgi:cytochrome b6-f complex iron-sulfur subunit